MPRKAMPGACRALNTSASPARSWRRRNALGLKHSCALTPTPKPVPSLSLRPVPMRRARVSVVEPASAGPPPATATAWHVLLLPPNLVGHARLLLTAAAAAAGGAHAYTLCVALFCTAFALDGLDGWLARRLGQATRFGAVYDVALDLVARALLWTWAVGGPAAVIPVLLECFTFAATHADAGAAAAAAAADAPQARHWKDAPLAPAWVRRVLGNGLRNPLGAWAVAGLYGCPLWLFARSVAAQQPALVLLAAPAWGLVVVPGRLLAAAVEVYLILGHLGRLLRADAEGLAQKRSGGG